MNKGSLEIVDLINLYLPKEYELELSFEDITKGWKAENPDFRMTRDVMGTYIMVNKKRMVSFTPELIIGTDLQHEIIISMLVDIGIDASAFKSVQIMSYNNKPIYIVKTQKSYGGLQSVEYTTKKDLVIERSPYLKYCTGMTYLNQVQTLWVKI